MNKWLPIFLIVCLSLWVGFLQGKISSLERISETRIGAVEAETKAFESRFNMFAQGVIDALGQVANTLSAPRPNQMLTGKEMGQNFLDYFNTVKNGLAEQGLM